MSFDPEPYAEGIRKRNAREAREIEEALVRARSEAERLARRILDEDPGVRRVWFFGSAATGECRDGYFDIDLAVEGGDLAKLEDLAADSPFKVDLVRMDLLSVEFRDLVRSRGIPIERSGAGASIGTGFHGGRNERR